MPYFANLQKVRSSDVILASFPRSGNTWMRLLFFSLSMQKNGNRPDVVCGKMASQVPSIDCDDLDTSLTLPGTDARFIKTHDGYAMYDYDDAQPDAPYEGWGGTFANIPIPHRPTRPGRWIYLFRKPTEALGSLFNFYYFNPENLGGEYKDFDEFCLARAERWRDHVSEYAAAAEKDDKAFLFLSYETMLADGPGMLARACRFIGMDATPEQIKTAIDNQSFERLRDRHPEERADERGRMFAQGQKDNWTKKLKPGTAEQVFETCEAAYQAACALERRHAARLDPVAS